MKYDYIALCGWALLCVTDLHSASIFMGYATVFGNIAGVVAVAVAVLCSYMAGKAFGRMKNRMAKSKTRAAMFAAIRDGNEALAVEMEQRLREYN